MFIGCYVLISPLKNLRLYLKHFLRKFLEKIFKKQSTKSFKKSNSFWLSNSRFFLNNHLLKAVSSWKSVKIFKIHKKLGFKTLLKTIFKKSKSLFYFFFIFIFFNFKTPQEIFLKYFFRTYQFQTFYIFRCLSPHVFSNRCRIKNSKFLLHLITYE